MISSVLRLSLPVLRLSLPVLSLLLSTSYGCSISCGRPGEYRVCADSWLGSDCSGFLGCVRQTQPCAGECPAEYPVVSEDGLRCSACQESSQGEGSAKVCPECEDGEVWCRVEQACKARTASCGGKCPSLLYPVLNVSQQECSPCPEYSRWCKEEGRCFDPEQEPCNGECKSWGLSYCPDTGTCLVYDAPCGPRRQVDLTPRIASVGVDQYTPAVAFGVDQATPADCNCSDLTILDGNSGRHIGNCLTSYADNFWCYVASTSLCTDRKTSGRASGLFYSFQACSGTLVKQPKPQGFQPVKEP